MRTVSLLLSAVTTLLVAGGCAGAEVAMRPVDRLAEARAMIPEQIRKSGELVGGTDPTFAPMTYMEGGNFTGLDVDLGNAIGAKLGLRVKWTNISFGKLLDNVQGHQVDFSMSSMFDKKTRQEKVDFIDYMNAGTSIVVAKGVGDIGGMAGLCGRRVAVQPETVFIDMAVAQNQQCGTKKITIVPSNGPSAAVQDGKADAALNDYPIAVLDVVKMPTVEISGAQIDALPYGIGVAKDRTALRTAMQTALYELFKDGTYDKLLTKYTVKDGGLKTGAINGGV